MSILPQSIGVVHGRAVAPRRARILSRLVRDVLPPGCRTVLDVGCGDGSIGAAIRDARPELSIAGIDVLARARTHVPCTLFDGTTIPHDDGRFDAVIMIDVLHHAADPERLLAEAARVARRTIVIKDHLREGIAAGATLRVMDWVGNRAHGVALPYAYWSRDEWHRALDRARLDIEQWTERLGLYPWPFSAAFDRRLHFIARLAREHTT